MTELEYSDNNDGGRSISIQNQHHFHIADDHPLFRVALTQVIESKYPDSRITQSQDLDNTLKDLRNMSEIDLLFLDLNMPGTMDLFGLINIRESFPTIPVVIVSANEEQTMINRAMGHGAMGYMTKSLSQESVTEGMHAILSGNTWVPEKFRLNLRSVSEEEKGLASKIASLTPQQYRVLCLLKEGWLNKQIGYEIGVTEATVKAHITAIFRKLEVSNRVQAVIKLNELSPELKHAEQKDDS
jgi:DNA-binding NarL/FixJ family response regulator